MKIISLQAEKIKRLVAVEIKPEGNIVEITGKNGQGKSSVLDCIWWALAGTSNIQVNPVHSGAESAKIKLDLGEIVVTRTFKVGQKGTTSSLKAEDASGKKINTTPQKLLDGLLGELTFDPMKFEKLSDKEQFDTLKKFVPKFDFEAIEKNNAKDYEDRAELKKQAKQARILADEINIPEGTPKEPINESDLVNQLENASVFNSDIERRKHNRSKLKEEIESGIFKAAEMRKEAEELIKKADILESTAKESQEKLDSAKELPSPIDISVVRKKLDEAKGINQLVELREAKRKEIEHAEDLEEKVQELTNSMKDREESKREAISKAKLPVKGIGFGEGFVTLNGQPFVQASYAEKLRSSIAIAMALNPDLKVIRVEDGSMLDKTSLNLLSEMAEEKDYQVWIEKVTEGDEPVGFVIEDGLVKNFNKTEEETEEELV